MIASRYRPYVLLIKDSAMGWGRNGRRTVLKARCTAFARGYRNAGRGHSGMVSTAFATAVKSRLACSSRAMVAMARTADS